MNTEIQTDRMIEVSYVGGPLDGRTESAGLCGFVIGLIPETITRGEFAGHHYCGVESFTEETERVVVFYVPPGNIDVGDSYDGWLQKSDCWDGGQR